MYRVQLKILQHAIWMHARRFARTDPSGSLSLSLSIGVSVSLYSISVSLSLSLCLSVCPSLSTSIQIIHVHLSNLSIAVHPSIKTIKTRMCKSL